MDFTGADRIEILPPMPGAAGVLPELAHCGWAIWREAIRDGYPTQTCDAYIINYFSSGSARWWVEDEMFDIGPGSLFVIRPNEVNGGSGSIMHACECHYICFRFPDGKPLPGLSLQQTIELASAFAGLEKRLFAGGAEIAECLRRLIAEQRQQGKFSAAIARGIFHQLLVLILRAHRTAWPAARGAEPRVAAHP